MSDMIQTNLEETILKLADLEVESPACPMAAADAYDALDREADFQIYTLKSISERDWEPWAQQVAREWLNTNGIS